MKIRTLLLVALGLSAFVTGCTTAPAPSAPTEKQTVVADVVEDTLSLGLVPVLTKNPDYVPIAAGIAAALATFNADSFAPADVDTILSRTALAPADRRTVAALVNAAWDTYSRRYAQQVSASVRPDVKLFVGAVRNGINRAIDALPPAS